MALKYQGLKMFFNMKVYYDAMKRLPEFAGLRGRAFPGKEPPLQPVILPRRPDLPLGFSDDWKKIGSRRQRQTVTIIVTPAEEENTLRPPPPQEIHSTDYYHP